MLKRILFLLVSLALTFQVFSQDVPVSVSHDKVKVDGKTYYVHIVKAGETLYSISKAYGVAQSEIAISNPDIYAGLKVGQALKIPAKVDEKQSDEDFVYHIVKRKETLFGISRMYNVTVDEIYALNPEAKEGLKTSQVLRIPRKNIKEIEMQPAVDSVEFILHEVQPREGLFAISKRYGVSPKEIEYYNFDLIKDGVKLGTTLRIPVRKTQPTAGEQKQEVSPDLTKSGCLTGYSYEGHPFNVSLLLPFSQLQGPAADRVTEEFDQQGGGGISDSKLSQLSQVSLEFYEGFLMALDSLKKSGVSVNLSVHDTKRSPQEVLRLLKRKSVAESELIIGPFMFDEIKPVAQFAQDHNINFVSPLFSNNQVLGNSPNIISVGQSFNSQLETFIKEFQFEPGTNYLIIFDSASISSSSIRNFDSLLTQKTKLAGASVVRYRHRAAYYKSVDVQERLFKMLKSDAKNVVIIPSDDEPFVTDILGSLYAVKSYYNLPVEVYGPSRWRRLRGIPIDYFFALNINLFSPFYVDYSKVEVKKFIANYRERFRAEPSQFSFLGYDVAFYFLNAMKKYGGKFNDCLTEYQIPLLQSQFIFSRNPEGFFQNTKLYTIRYAPDYTLIVK